jgi:hypothetical protein
MSLINTIINRGIPDVLYDVIFTSSEDPSFVIKSEPRGQTHEKADMCSYIYHENCGKNSCQAEDECEGWVSAWDTRHGVCFHCKATVPEDAKAVWVLHNAEVLGGYMYEKEGDGDLAERYLSD